VSRLTYQKGYDLLLRIVTQLIDIPGQLAILGSGEAMLEQELMRMARNHSGKMAVRLGFDEKLAHLIEAGADSFLMPSRFEPCGLNQMYSQCYGTPPLVHGTGGLLDTVVDCTPQSLADGTATGFVFHELTPEAFLGTLERTVAAYRDKPVWCRLMRNGMAQDFSWRASAADYQKIYLSLLNRKR
jgi:starch synthase